MKKIIIVMTLLLSSSVLFSQEKGHYLSVGGTLGSSSLNYSLLNGKGGVKPGWGYGGKIGYAYFFHKNFGVGTGFGVSAYKPKASIKYYEITFPNLTDDEGDMYNRKVILTNWKEKHKTILLEIPLLLHFQCKFGDYQAVGLYANIGAKAQIPVGTGYKVTDGDMETQGQYHKWGFPLFVDMPNHGFGTEAFRPQGDIKLKTGFAATAGLGLLIELSRTIDLSLGGYIDYGFTNMKKAEEGSIVYLDNSQNNQYRSLLTSSDIGNVNAVSAGVEVGLRFKLDGSKRETKEQIKERKEAEKEAEKEEKAAKEKELKEEAKKAEKRDTEADRRADELNRNLTSGLKNIEDLLAKALNKKDAKVERARDDDNVEMVKTNFDADILFETGSSNLAARSKEMLVPLVQSLQENPYAYVDIFGHTDDVASLEFNQKLSTQRAQQVAEFLINMGVKRNQIKRVIGKNYSMPVASNATPEGRAKNRRVEVWLYVERE